MKIAITGANSGVGRLLLPYLTSRAGVEVVACVRSAKAAAALPEPHQSRACTIDYGDPGGLASALRGADCLVHLAGILFECPATTYETGNVQATRAVVEACTQAGIRRLVLVSVLGANAAAANPYLRSKGRAEQLVSASALSAAIVRTGILLGPGMAGARALVHAASQRRITLLGGGRHVVRPLDVDDLSVAIARCCESAETGVAVHELVGPTPVAYRDVVATMAALLGHDASIRSLPIWLARTGAAFAGWARRGGLTPAVIDVITSSEIVHENADVRLGVALTPLPATLEKILRATREAPRS